MGKRSKRGGLVRRWSFDDVEVNDISLEDYIAVKTKFAVSLPK